MLLLVRGSQRSEVNLSGDGTNLGMLLPMRTGVTGKALARRLQTILRATDSAFRLGGDEFVFLLNDLECWTDLRGDC